MDLGALRGIASHFIEPSGAILPFSQQVESYAYGSMPSGDQFVLGTSSHALGLPMLDDLPVSMAFRSP